MKIIFSRKAFDSSAGGCASPIMPDGTLVPLPIPDKTSPIRYEQIDVFGHPLGRMVPDLTGGKQKAHYGAHLDPDVIPGAYPREVGWRPLFGQGDAAQTRLERDGVGVGDLFLFFGWFRRAELYSGVYRFVKGAPDLHVLWGWLQVAEVWPAGGTGIPQWALYHPHIADGVHWRNNTLYVATPKLRIGTQITALPGGGAFARFDAHLQLTKVGASRSVWSLPRAFAPTPGRPPLGYHFDSSRWTEKGEQVDLQTVARGQEFALDLTQYPDCVHWLERLFDLHPYSERAGPSPDRSPDSLGPRSQ